MERTFGTPSDPFGATSLGEGGIGTFMAHSSRGLSAKLTGGVSKVGKINLMITNCEGMK